MSTKLNLTFYAGLLESMKRSIAGFQAIVDRERAEKEEALQLASELEAEMSHKNDRIAELETENAQLKTGFESVELEQLQEIGEQIEQLHNAIADLNNPTSQEPSEESETEEVDESETENETEIEEETDL